MWKGRVLLFAKSQSDIDIVLLLGFVILHRIFVFNYIWLNSSWTYIYMADMITGPGVREASRGIVLGIAPEDCPIDANVHFLRALVCKHCF